MHRLFRHRRTGTPVHVGGNECVKKLSYGILGLRNCFGTGTNNGSPLSLSSSIPLPRHSCFKQEPSCRDWHLLHHDCFGLTLHAAGFPSTFLLSSFLAIFFFFCFSLLRPECAGIHDVWFRLYPSLHSQFESNSSKLWPVLPTEFLSCVFKTVESQPA